MLYLNECEQWISDIDKIFPSLQELSELQGKIVMITGATGLIGSSVTDVLIRYNETHEQAIEIVVAGRNKEKIRTRFGRFTERDYFKIVQYDATIADNDLNFHVDYVIHCASNAYPALIASEPVETMLSNFIGVKELLDYAIKYQVKRLLYISSSEVYGQKKSDGPFLENDYGYIDLLNPRNSYSISKRAAETLCLSYADEYGVNSVIVRPGHIYGPTASENDNRVSSAWAFAVSRGENIIMKSSGEQIRSYCYCLDCASAILKVLIKGKAGEAYNISNPNSIISIRQIAELFAGYGNVSVKFEIPTEQEKSAFNPMLYSSLNSEKLQKLGWNGTFGPDVGIDHTIRILRETI